MRRSVSYNILILDIKQEISSVEQVGSASCILAILKKYHMDLMQQFEAAVAASKTLAEKAIQ